MPRLVASLLALALLGAPAAPVRSAGGPADEARGAAAPRPCCCTGAAECRCCGTDRDDPGARPTARGCRCQVRAPLGQTESRPDPDRAGQRVALFRTADAAPAPAPVRGHESRAIPRDPPRPQVRTPLLL